MPAFSRCSQLLGHISAGEYRSFRGGLQDVESHKFN
nr:MAG TPA_asm: hypothetical protein [Caudoviricetes sp.]